MTFDCAVLNRQRGRRVGVGALRAFMLRLGREWPPARSADVAICLVSDRRMRELNRRFRGKDAATDVLAFPDGEPAAGEGVHLGDVVISVERAAHQAREREHSLPRELKILALHGYLHLLGHDHETDGGRMLRLQRRIVRRLLPRRERRSER